MMKRRLPMISSVLYVLAWIIGLSTGAPNLSLTATASEVTTAYTTHKTGGVLEFIIAEGLTGIFLIVVVLSVMKTARKRKKAHYVFLSSGMVAGILSIVMSAMGLLLILSVIPHGIATHITQLNDAVNRLDGPKMWLLGIMAVSAVMAWQLPAWLKVGGYVLAASLLLSGISYGLLLQSIGWSAYIAGVLLLVWVGGFGAVLGTRKRDK